MAQHKPNNPPKPSYKPSPMPTAYNAPAKPAYQSVSYNHAIHKPLFKASDSAATLIKILADED